MTGPTFNTRKRRVFDAVFAGVNISQPTPVATPATGFTAPGQNFGGPLSSNNDRRQAQISDVRAPHLFNASDHIRDQVHWDRSWHTVTHALNVPALHGNPSEDRPNRETLDAAFYEALEDLLDPHTRLPFAAHTESIIVWHTQQVRQHFLREILPAILRTSENDAESLLINSVKILDAAHRQYLHSLSIILDHINRSMPMASQLILQNFRRDLHAIVSNSVCELLSDALAKTLRRQVSTILGLPSGNEPLKSLVRYHDQFTPQSSSRSETASGSGRLVISAAEGTLSEKARREMLDLIRSFQNVGLAGEQFQIIFAEIMNDSMSEFVYRGCKGLWSQENLQPHEDSEARSQSILPRAAHHSSPSRCVAELCDWIENRYAKLAVQVFSILDNAKVTWADNGKYKDLWTEKERYKDMSIGRLAELRTNELFDIVMNWPDSSGALDDLRTAITTPQRRLHLTDVFAKNLSERLLHPGASTLQILQTYISMIWSFHALDHSKVLLDRVAYPLQLYLCSREDTVRIIITGLLSDTEDARGNPIAPGGDRLVELALLLNDDSDQVGQKAKDEDLDWYDLEWIPDPVDAGPGYKRSKNADIIGTLIGVLGAQEVFIKEFQNMIGENLLKQEGSFEKEIKVLELLKIRFGEAPLQSCEVMLKDIQDSGRLDGVIRRNEKLDPSEQELNAARRHLDVTEEDNINPEGLLKASLHAKILSRLFWPQLHDGGYRIPDEIAELQKRYEHGFESLKTARKLTWLHALGQATVELELKDRTIVEEVHTWQAAVIWAFQSDEPGDTTAKRSVEELVQTLKMEEALVRSALKFWINKLVLQEAGRDFFAVLETLNQEARARSNAQATAATAAVLDGSADDTALMGNDGITTERMQMYWQFIQGMLTNSSSQMPLQQIAMMLKMLIVDGFPYGNEELQEFLGQKVADGELELVGGKYKLKK